MSHPCPSTAKGRPAKGLVVLVLVPLGVSCVSALHCVSSGQHRAEPSALAGTQFKRNLRHRRGLAVLRHGRGIGASYLGMGARGEER